MKEGSLYYPLVNQKIAVLGLGKSGLAAIELALAKKASSIVVYDEYKQQLPEQYSNHNTVISGDINALMPIDLLILSPGVNPHSSYAKKLITHSLQVISEVEFAAQWCHVPIIAITGTNGKTTTVELLAHLLQTLDKKVLVCGNHDIPLSSAVLRTANKKLDYYLIEVSSFQLESTHYFSPHIAIWLNFAADHQDRHLSMAEYYQAKKRIFQNLKQTDLAIVPTSADFADIKPKRAFLEDSAPQALTYRHHNIYQEGTKQEILSLPKHLFQTQHDQTNLVASLYALQFLHLLTPIHCTILQQHWQNYRKPQHRCQVVTKVAGMTFINDSKSTNIHSVLAALQTLEAPVIWIAGGKDKQLDYTSLIPVVQEKVTYAIFIGEIAEQLVAVFQQAITTYIERDLAAAIATVKQHEIAGATVILSPGTSSFDQYPQGFAQRGEHYIELIKQIYLPHYEKT